MSYLTLDSYPFGCNSNDMKRTISQVLKAERKRASLTQQEFAMRSRLGLRFVRELEQGKPAVRMDKVAEALSFFSYHIEPVPDEQK